MADNTFVFDNERLKKMGKTVTQQFALPIVYFNPLAHLFWLISYFLFFFLFFFFSIIKQFD